MSQQLLSPSRFPIDKRLLRQQMLEKRQRLSGYQQSAAAESIARHFADHPILAFAQSFAGYVAMRGELDIMPTFRIMARLGRPTALPRMEPRTRLLHFREWREGDPLEPGAFSVREPKAEAPAFLPKLVLVPTLAFDARGVRLGYGGGWYDRTMQHLRSLPTPPLFVGVAHSIQELPELPLEPHDELLDGILTELGVSMFARA